MPAFDTLMTLVIELGPLTSLGTGAAGERRMARIAGGRFEGAVAGRALRGTVEPGAVDWQLLHPDGTLEIDAQYVLREDCGGAIRVHNQGLRHGPAEVLAALARGEAVDPSAYFFRSLLRFETAAPELSALNRTLAVASAQRRGGEVRFEVHALR